MASYIYSVENPGPQQIEAIRKRAYHYLSPCTASVAGMRLDQLVQFCAGTFFPTPWQLHQLSLQMSIYQEARKVG